MAFPILQDTLLTNIHFFLYYLNPFIVTLRIRNIHKGIDRGFLLYITKPKFWHEIEGPLPSTACSVSHMYSTCVSYHSLQLTL